MTTRYPEHYLKTPSKREYKALEAIRNRAEAEPLKGGDQLSWVGPSLESDVFPPEGYSNSSTPPASRPRSLHHRLVDKREGPTSLEWTLTLLEPLKAGANNYSQIWRAHATSTTNPSPLPVVLKLFQQSLFPYPEPVDSHPPSDSWNWYSARYLQEREAQAYRICRNLQGSDLPLCYGFWSFKISSGESVTGCVLEDLVSSGKGISLRTHFLREAKLNHINLETFDKLVCAAHLLQGRMHEAGIAHPVWDIEKIILLRSYSNDESIVMVGVGFGVTSTKATMEEERRQSVQAAKRKNQPDPDVYDWEDRDVNILWDSFVTAMYELDGSLYEMTGEWVKMEMARQKLGFIKPLEESESEGDDEEGRET